MEECRGGINGNGKIKKKNNMIQKNIKVLKFLIGWEEMPKHRGVNRFIQS